MHHGTCVTHVPWCIPGSLTSNFLWSRWRGKRSRHSRHMCNQQFCVSGKRCVVTKWGSFRNNKQNMYTPSNDINHEHQSSLMLSEHTMDLRNTFRIKQIFWSTFSIKQAFVVWSEFRQNPVICGPISYATDISRCAHKQWSVNPEVATLAHLLFTCSFGYSCKLRYKLWVFGISEIKK